MSKKDINKNAFYNTVKTIFGIVFPLITFPYISRILGAENVGKINFSNSIVSYISLVASLGVTTYAVREGSKVKANQEKYNIIASQLFSINIVSTLVSYLVMLLLIGSIGTLDEYRLLIIIQSSTVMFSTLGAEWVNTSFEDFKYIAIRTITIQLMSLLLMFVFVQEEKDYIVYALISMLASSGANIINIFYREKHCKIRFTTKMEAKKHLPQILLLFSMILSQTIYVNSDVTMLGFIRGDYEVGLYSTSVKIYSLVNSVIASIAWVVMPQLSALYSKKDYENINKLLKYSLNYIIVLGVPCFAGINAIAPQLIETIAGKEYLGATTSLRILSFSLIFSLLGGFVGNIIMLPSGREKICLRTCIVSALTNLVANCILIPRWGLNGAAFTTALAEMIGLIIISSKIEKEIEIENLTEMIKAPSIGAVLIFLYAICIKINIYNSYAVTIITILGSIAIYILTLWILKNKFFVDLCNTFFCWKKN